MKFLFTLAIGAAIGAFAMHYHDESSFAHDVDARVHAVETAATSSSSR